MTANLLPFPPVIDQPIRHVPLDIWSAVGFVVVILACGYLAYRRSAWSIAILAFLVPFAGYRDIANTTLTIEKCVAFGTALGLLLGGAPALPRTRNARFVLYAACGLLVTILLSLSSATYPVHVAREFLKQVEYLILFWCAATLIEQNARSQKTFYLGIGISSLIVSMLAVSQAIIGGAPSGMWVNGHPLPRVAGTLEGPNQLAGYLEAALPVLWVTPLLGSFVAPLRRFTTGTCAAALILTQSRAGVLVTLLSYAGLWKIDRLSARRVRTAMITGIVFGLLVTIAWFEFYAHASSADIARLFSFAIPQQPGGVGTRSQLWPAAIALFIRHPLFGVGAGNYELLLPTVGLFGVKTHASSLWLQTLAEQGLCGIIALIVFAWVALRQTFVLRVQSPLALAAFLAMASLLAHQLVDDLFFFPKVAGLAWLLLGAGCAMHLEKPASASGNGMARSIIGAGANEPVAEPR